MLTSWPMLFSNCITIVTPIDPQEVNCNKGSYHFISLTALYESVTLRKQTRDANTSQKCHMWARGMNKHA